MIVFYVSPSMAVDGKRDHRGRVMYWKQSRRLFPEIRDEDNEN